MAVHNMSSVPAQDIDIPLVKRQKIVQSQSSAKQESSSRIFSHFRTLGLVSPTSVPFTSVRLGKSTYQITTSIGNVLQTYDFKRGLSLVFASQPQTPKPITATFAWKNFVFAAWGGQQAGEQSGVWVFRRGKKVASLQATPFAGPITRLLVFGSWIVGCCERSIQIWNSTSYTHYTTLIPQASQSDVDQPIFTGHVCTMPTYLNKILVGRYDGTVEIWNISSGKLLYTILPPTAKDGAVTAIEPTPALSLIAIAYKAGTIVIRNVDSGKEILCLNSNLSDAPPVTSISFRTDGLGAGEDGRLPGVMATATVYSGDITLWDLNNGGRRTGSLRGAHDLRQKISDGGVNKIEFLDGQPFLISSGRDNALRSWIFDETPFSPIPRPLHSRGGHAAAVSTISFLPASSDGSDSIGKWLLSASKDRSLWSFSLRKDSQNTEMSQGSTKTKSQKKGMLRNGTSPEDLKAPEITSIACSLNRDAGMGVSSQQVWTNSRDTKTLSQNMNGWESVVTGHKGDKFARTWYWGKKKAGRWAFETSDGTEVKSVAISSCGTFAVIGSSGGSVDMFNLQSGMHRKQFPPLTRKSRLSLPVNEADESERRLKKHTKAVTGLAIDSLNRNVVSCGLDGKLKFWDFSTGNLLTELDWSPMTAITGLRSSNINELVALSCDDLSIRIVDWETKRVVRELWGCRGQINDFAFSNDGRWIIASSMDSAIRVWDLPTGHLIDIIQVPTTCTALAFSGTGEFLATAHADELGIHIWNNKSLFSSVQLNHIDEREVEQSLGSTAITEMKSGIIDAAFALDKEDMNQETSIAPAEQLSDDLMTLSIVPRVSWQTLINLETIKERNKPKEPAKTPERAPFFLPSIDEKQQVTSDAGFTDGHATNDASQISVIQNLQNQPSQKVHVGKLLSTGASRQNFAPFIDYFKTLSPGKIDLEIRSLNVQFSQGRCELVEFVNALTERLRQKKDFELVNAWMAVFLKVHGELIRNIWETQDSEVDSARALQTALAAWKSEQQREAKRLSELMGYCRGIVGFLRSSR